MKNKNLPLWVLSIIYLVSIVLSAMYRTDLENSWFSGISGNLIISAFSGIVFFFIGMHFQKENNVKINNLHRQLERNLTIENYERMVSFLKSERRYNFFLPEHSTSDGHWYAYSLRGKSNGENAVAFSMQTHQEYVVYVDDISHRNVLDADRLAEYVYGPLKVGNCYYLLFSGDKMYLERAHEGKRVEICWMGSDPEAYTLPSANALYFSSNLEGKTLVESFIYNRDGEEVHSGWGCEIFKDESNQIYIRLAQDGELKRVIVTYEDEDYEEEEPFIKIEKVEGYFSSVGALNNFKNLINQKIMAKDLKIPVLPSYNDNLVGQ